MEECRRTHFLIMHLKRLKFSVNDDIDCVAMGENHRFMGRMVSSSV
jgi:hypothetical protein